MDGKRLSAVGMRKSYLSKAEIQDLASRDQKESAVLRHSLYIATAAKRSSEAWIEELDESCTKNDEVQFIKDCIALFKQRDSDEFPVQMKVIQNLIGKLRRGRNQHYGELIKTISKMYKNCLGSSNYAVLQVIHIKSVFFRSKHFNNGVY